jgi:hypothetical protein
MRSQWKALLRKVVPAAGVYQEGCSTGEILFLSCLHLTGNRDHTGWYQRLRYIKKAAMPVRVIATASKRYAGDVRYETLKTYDAGNATRIKEMQTFSTQATDCAFAMLAYNPPLSINSL